MGNKKPDRKIRILEGVALTESVMDASVPLSSNCKDKYDIDI